MLKLQIKIESKVATEKCKQDQAQIRNASYTCKRFLHDEIVHECDKANAAWCNDLPLSITKYGGRPYRDAPFRVEGCNLKWYSSAQACDLVTKSGRLILVGDSLVRHLSQTMIAILRGNLSRDGVTPNAPENCSCDTQYYKECRPFCAGGYNAEQSLVCPQWDVPRYFNRWTAGKPVNASQKPWTYEKELRHLQDTLESANISGSRVVVFFMVGNHPMSLMKEGMTPQMIIDNNYAPRLKLLQSYMDQRRKLSSGSSFQRDIMMVGTNTPPGPNKPKKYLEFSGYGSMLAIAEASRRFAAEYEGPSYRDRADFPFVTRFDTFAVMDNVSAFDGTHFALRGNVALAQVFLNVLEWAIARA